ncbi:recombinase family protein [Bradyrhizobium sp. S3.5.5]|uniref:recombinase family protein n=1 Tax=Bradyrhizobium sp. S3.5.5 TaxID=3156430 RepID=UPI00339B60D4
MLAAGDVILVARMDRLARSIRDPLNLVSEITMSEARRSGRCVNTGPTTATRTVA